MANVKLVNVNKIYDNNVQAVFDFNLDIKDKEFIVFVGPSGCGKTTTLRMIAGLEDISSGELYIDDEEMTNVDAKKRNIAMVFQNYALYPHMTVYQNLSFSLENQKFEKSEIDKKVKDAAKLLGIEEYLDRRPKELSGGQRQRVALGRAIVRNAKVFLMDEPLSNLDAKLRILMRTELIRLHKNIGATTIYVTHDQTEAMTMADRIVVMDKGYIQQVGTPEYVYSNPANLFVAGFLGSPQINLIDAHYSDKKLTLNNGRIIELPLFQCAKLEKYKDKDLIFGIRPEDIYAEDIVKETYPSARFQYNIEVHEMLGNEYILHGNIEGTELTMRVSLRIMEDRPEHIDIAFDLDKCHIFDKETGVTIF